VSGRYVQETLVNVKQFCFFPPRLPPPPCPRSCSCAELCHNPRVQIHARCSVARVERRWRVDARIHSSAVIVGAQLGPAPFHARCLQCVAQQNAIAARCASIHWRVLGGTHAYPLYWLHRQVHRGREGGCAQQQQSEPCEPCTQKVSDMSFMCRAPATQHASHRIEGPDPLRNLVIK
jgi:hypothetical protein